MYRGSDSCYRLVVCADDLVQQPSGLRPKSPNAAVTPATNYRLAILSSFSGHARSELQKPHDIREVRGARECENHEEILDKNGWPEGPNQAIMAAQDHGDTRSGGSR